MNSEALTGGRVAVGLLTRPPDLRFRVTSCGRPAAPIPSSKKGERRLPPMPAMPVGREEEVGAEDAAAAARVGAAAARGAFIGGMGARAENRRWGRGARWRASSEMGAGGEPTPDGAMPRARGRGQPRGRKVASDGWEAAAGVFSALGFPAGGAQTNGSLARKF